MFQPGKGSRARNQTTWAPAPAPGIPTRCLPQIPAPYRLQLLISLLFPPKSWCSPTNSVFLRPSWAGIFWQFCLYLGHFEAQKVQGLGKRVRDLNRKSTSLDGFTEFKAHISIPFGTNVNSIYSTMAHPRFLPFKGPRTPTPQIPLGLCAPSLELRFKKKKNRITSL